MVCITTGVIENTSKTAQGDKKDFTRDDDASDNS